MKGFRVKINGEVIQASILEGALNILLVLKDEEGFISIKGLDSTKQQFVIWIERDILLEEKILIELTEFASISKIQNFFLNDREILKREYYKLKEELGKNGMI